MKAMVDETKLRMWKKEERAKENKEAQAHI